MQQKASLRVAWIFPILMLVYAPFVRSEVTFETPISATEVQSVATANFPPGAEMKSIDLSYDLAQDVSLGQAYSVVRGMALGEGVAVAELKPPAGAAGFGSEFYVEYCEDLQKLVNARKMSVAAQYNALVLKADASLNVVVQRSTEHFHRYLYVHCDVSLGDSDEGAGWSLPANEYKELRKDPTKFFTTRGVHFVAMKRRGGTFEAVYDLTTDSQSQATAIDARFAAKNANFSVAAAMESYLKQQTAGIRYTCHILRRGTTDPIPDVDAEALLKYAREFPEKVKVAPATISTRLASYSELKQPQGSTAVAALDRYWPTVGASLSLAQLYRAYGVKALKTKAELQHALTVWFLIKDGEKSRQAWQGQLDAINAALAQTQAFLGNPLASKSPYVALPGLSATVIPLNYGWTPPPGSWFIAEHLTCAVKRTASMSLPFPYDYWHVSIIPQPGGAADAPQWLLSRCDDKVNRLGPSFTAVSTFNVGAYGCASYRIEKDGLETNQSCDETAAWSKLPNDTARCYLNYALDGLTALPQGEASFRVQMTYPGYGLFWIQGL